MSAGWRPRAGQVSRWYPSVPGPSLCLSWQGQRAVICWPYRSRGMAWSRSRVVAVISGSGRAGQYQVPSTRMAPPVLAWMPGWPAR